MALRGWEEGAEIFLNRWRLFSSFPANPLSGRAGGSQGQLQHVMNGGVRRVFGTVHLEMCRADTPAPCTPLGGIWIPGNQGTWVLGYLGT